CKWRPDPLVSRKYRKGLYARAYFYLVMLISLPLYPAPGLMAIGIHNRPLETATILRLTGLTADKKLVVSVYEQYPKVRVID
ncbi:hypothetical protein KAR91_05430, partial [Candidatus Pacearchaeota archaeon]|nr:hypothetical protein [Candidatus Pacearchaeota archaeon]